MVFTLLNFFFFNDTATTKIYTLSLHDALPIFHEHRDGDLPQAVDLCLPGRPRAAWARDRQDRKSTRLNSSHRTISYAVFCLKKKKERRKEKQSIKVVLGTDREEVTCQCGIVSL